MIFQVFLGSGIFVVLILLCFLGDFDLICLVIDSEWICFYCSRISAPFVCYCLLLNFSKIGFALKQFALMLHEVILPPINNGSPSVSELSNRITLHGQAYSDDRK
jgi:hypothetical protein